jgi:predicted nucleic-acid-binding Zn-ribbon protein
LSQYGEWLASENLQFLTSFQPIIIGLVCNGKPPSVTYSNAAMTNNREGHRYIAAGKPVVCPHCGGETFASREILMNTRGATFFNFDWLNKAALALTCATCGRIEWFNDALEPITQQ